MKTVSIVESLLFRIPNLRKALSGLNILSMDRRISSSEHPEFNNILSPFKTPKIISVIGTIQLTMIIEPEKVGRVYNVILIRGYECEIVQMSKTLIIDTLNKHLIWKDYLPEAFIKKIIYIDYYSNEKITGVVFSEYEKNKWTIDNPLKINITNKDEKITGKAIITEVIDDILK